MSDPILQITPLGSRWQTQDPFLFCVHHVDHFPKGNDQFGPAASLAGHPIGQDFEGKDGWRMYHGDVVPGFPQHPHRGFETVTIVRRGYIDHSDSLGAAARFGLGDVQWLTAGAGVVHSEMFPLLDKEGPNTLELFQIWLNLPAKSKLADPYFTMFWDKDLPRLRHTNAAGKLAEVTVIAGAVARSVEGGVAEGAAADDGSSGVAPLAPPPQSWAADPASDVAIWSISLEPGASWTVPPAREAKVNRSLNLFAGSALAVNGRRVPGPAAIHVRPDQALEIEAVDGPADVLLLQGCPIGEPVAQHGPFVMNTRAELEQAFEDYQRTQFGGWPWPVDAPVHPPDAGRFARHADGRVERAE
jgi:redox-sensitive bicupin YhaK (pirin superfamily)